ncbi:hypothetical protein PAECIP111891_00710 [Paenibacillus allorhizoplanae]|uniref:Uncharacterized protein n=1 Tax=Paenibacillus allorhizoplanae TaxID=2905648 RepID=A0ABM9BVD7_9BACL|nr:hypothetical protein [Paenibacillus allorhizoplanae]CAH1195617.1 hypothetical protein PAECIP111891_00710 [Paenibacillus allorhizoplanae]
MKKRLTIFFAAAVILIGVYFISELFRTEPPKPTITAGDKKIAFAQGSYCWSGLFSGKCSDMVAPPELIKYAGLNPVVVSPESQITIKFRKKPKKNSLGAQLWKNNDRTSETVQLKNQILTVPKEKGVYIYGISANWSKGSSMYFFVIEV